MDPHPSPRTLNANLPVTAVAWVWKAFSAQLRSRQEEPLKIVAWWGGVRSRGGGVFVPLRRTAGHGLLLSLFLTPMGRVTCSALHSCYNVLPHHGGQEQQANQTRSATPINCKTTQFPFQILSWTVQTHFISHDYPLTLPRSIKLASSTPKPRL